MATSHSIDEAMKVSLWGAGELRGDAELSDVVALPLRAPAMNGPFAPTTRFADLWPVLQEANRCGAAIVAYAGRLAPGLPPERFREELLASVPAAATAALETAARAVSALGLELRDDAGNAIAAASIQVTEWSLFSSTTGSQETVENAEAEAARQGIPTRGHLLVATCVGPTISSVPPAI